MSDLVSAGLEQLQTYFRAYGLWFVFAALFLENVMFLGVLIPGAVVLVMAGWLAQQEGQGFPYWLAVVGYLGTVAGDSVSFTIGRKAGGRLLKSERWGKGLAAASERVRAEPALLMFCHFGSYLRMFVPAAAGMSGISFRRWLMLDATGAALWITAHVAVGYFLSLSGALASSKKIAVVIIVLVLAFIAVRYYRAMRRARREADTGQ
jgi:membrane-associated protein